MKKAPETKSTQNGKAQLEFKAIQHVHEALEKLDSEARARVLSYVGKMLGISSGSSEHEETSDLADPKLTESQPSDEKVTASRRDSQNSGDLEGVSPTAKKWLTRNSWDESKLASIFSLGVDEIDLIAKKVPGKNKTEKAHNIFLLKGAASYIGTGAARFTHQQVKEACVHYGAFDATNFAAQIKGFSGTVSGSKETGYSLTPRGLAEATTLISGMIS
jgi:hypothetical protein